MRVFKRLVVALAILLALLIAGAYLIPRDVTVTRSITIDAPPDKVFPLVNSLQEGRKWSPWLGLDPAAKLSFSGPESGVGNALEWASEHPNVGNGKQVISVSEVNERVVSELDFGEMGTAKAEFLLKPAGTGTLVTWRFETDMGNNPLSRWMGLMMDRWVGRDYEKGLANLKKLAEGG